MTRPTPSRRPSAACTFGTILASFALVLGLAACGGSDDQPAGAKQPSYLFNVTAGQGLYRHGKLVLLDVSRLTNAFTERPARAISLLSTRDFSNQFNDLFVGDPPNAAYTGVDFKADRLTGAILELTDPNYDDRVDALTFDAKQIGDLKPPRRLSDITVTIDDAGNYSPAEISEPDPVGGYQPTAPPLPSNVPPGATVIYQQAPSPSEAYPAPPPMASYPPCKRGQYDNCVERGSPD